MVNVSQNRKIAVAAVAIFAVSFSLMMFFLNRGGHPAVSGKADILGSHAGEESPLAEVSLITDEKGLVRYAQEDFCAGLGLKCADLMGKSLFDYVHADDTADLVALQTRILQEKEEVGLEGPFRFKGEAERLVLLSATPILEEEEVAEIEFVVKDLTDKMEGLDGGSEAVEEDKGGDWVDRLYPQIKQLDDGGRLMVDKITYKKD